MWWVGECVACLEAPKGHITEKSLGFEKQMAAGFVVSTVDSPRTPVCPESWPCSCFCTGEETDSSSCIESQSYLYCADPTQRTPSTDHQSPISLTGDNLHSQHALGFSGLYDATCLDEGSVSGNCSSLGAGGPCIWALRAGLQAAALLAVPSEILDHPSHCLGPRMAAAINCMFIHPREEGTAIKGACSPQPLRAALPQGPM